MGMTTVGKALASALFGNVGSPTAITHIALGSGTTAFAATQTALVTEIVASGLVRTAATPTQVTTTVTNDTTQITYTWTATGSATVAESAPFNAAAAGTMPCRQVLGTARALATGDQITVTWKVKNA